MDYDKINECKKNNIKLLHFTYDKRIKPNVSYKVYNNIDDLINIIDEHIKMGG